MKSSDSSTSHRKLPSSLLMLLLGTIIAIAWLLTASTRASAGNDSVIYLPLVFGDTPTERTLTSDKSSVNANAQECTTVRWQFFGAESVIMNRAKGFIQREMGADIGSVQVCPSVTTEFIATATFPDGSQEMLSTTVDVTGNECNQDPWIASFKPTASQVNRNERITVTWDVRCNSETYLKVGVDPEHHVPDFKQNEYTIEVSKEFRLRVTGEDSGGGIVFDERAVFGVTVRPNTREETEIIIGGN